MHTISNQQLSEISGGNFVSDAINAIGYYAGAAFGHVTNAVTSTYNQAWADSVWENREAIIAADSSGML